MAAGASPSCTRRESGNIVELQGVNTLGIVACHSHRPPHTLLPSHPVHGVVLLLDTTLQLFNFTP